MRLIQAAILSLAPSLTSFVIVALLLGGCMPPPTYEVQDLSEMPQLPGAYLNETTATTPLMDAAQQYRAKQDFLARHFSPWQAEAPLEETQHPFWALDWLESEERFGHNLLPMENEALTALQQRCAAADYPSMQRHAISVAHTDVRALPSAAPIFNDPRQTGEGYPFDYLQHGVLNAGTPLLITHASREGNWLFIETPLLYGWVPATTVARVDDSFKDAYTSAEYITILEDGHPLQSTAGGSLPPTRAGTILPLLEDTATGYVVAIPHVTPQGNATLERASISRGSARTFPLPFTPARVAQVSSHFMQQPYSWGDRFSGRDCSGTMRDLFAPFGIWLPRNSGDQAEVGRAITLEEIPVAERHTHIVAKAVPFATLLHLPGHIMLYLGQYEGKSAVLHAVWGIRTHALSGAEGRIRIGKTVITSLEPGEELDGMWRQVPSLLGRLDQMNILHQRRSE